MAVIQPFRQRGGECQRWRYGSRGGKLSAMKILVTFGDHIQAVRAADSKTAESSGWNAWRVTGSVG